MPVPEDTAMKIVIPIDDDVDEDFGQLFFYEFGEKTSMYHSIKGFTGIKKGTVCTTAIIDIVVDGFSQAIDGMRCGMFFLKPN